MSGTFSEADLEPSSEDLRRIRTARLEKLAATTATLAAGVIVGGLIGLGACAAPAVFRLAPAPYSGDAMAVAFARFDRVAVLSSCVALGAEVLRTFLARRSRPRPIARVRRLAGMLLAGAVAYMAMTITPAIADLHAKGVVRGQGTEGASLDTIHARAELVGKVEAMLALLVIGLHVFTVRSPTDIEADEEEGAPGPLPPGPTPPGSTPPGMGSA